MKKRLIFALTILTACAPQPPDAISWYEQCAQQTPPPSFIKMVECGKSRRTASCTAYGECSIGGNAIVAYADSLAKSVKKHELTEEEAWRKWIEFKMQQYQAEARQAQRRAAMLSAMNSMQPSSYHSTLPVFSQSPNAPSMPPTMNTTTSAGLMNSYIQPPPTNSGMGQGARGYNGTTYIPAGPNPNPPADVMR